MGLPAHLVMQLCADNGSKHADWLDSLSTVVSGVTSVNSITFALISVSCSFVTKIFPY
jgi:hypothetical protein